MYFKSNGCEVSQGNSKIGTDTIIINMGSAAACPSAKKGLCKLGLRCYALKAEKIYPSVAPYRDRQASYWLNTSAKKIAASLITIINKRNKNSRVINYLRFNESGDFYSQADITKLARVAAMISASTGVIVYGYTARKDLDFSKIRSFLVKGSSNGAGNNGMTVARLRGKIAKQKEETGKADYHEIIGGTVKRFVVCPGDCRPCQVCKIKNGVNVVFPIH
ncbi:MAG: hypothetical protein KAI17_25150 [Thiotrichaceae bacterium]|nr:hypothetical protein [Thiotrichaceae bacterium]